MSKPALHWVLVETGANQAYIFDSNRFRHAVGASQLVYQLGTSWVSESCGGLVGVHQVLAISGKALLLVEDPETGREIIERITSRTLLAAPGLQVTGCVGPSFDPGLAWHQASQPGPARFTHVEALEDTYRLIEDVRASRPPAEARDPMLPWFATCADTGLPAAGTGWHVDDEDAAASVLAKSGSLPAVRASPSHLPQVRRAILDRAGW